jgi:hypothetical protein
MKLPLPIMFNLRRLYFDFTFYLLPSNGISSSFMPVYLLLVGIVVVEVKLAFFAVSEYDHFSCSCSLPSHLSSEFVLGAIPSFFLLPAWDKGCRRYCILWFTDFYLSAFYSANTFLLL